MHYKTKLNILWSNNREFNSLLLANALSNRESNSLLLANAAIYYYY